MLFLHFSSVLDLTDIAMGDNSNAPKKKANKNTAIMAAAFSWSTGGYDLLVHVLLVDAFAVLSTLIDMSVICLVRTSLFTYLYQINIDVAINMVYLCMKLIRKLLIYPTSARNTPSTKVKYKPNTDQAFNLVALVEVEW